VRSGPGVEVGVLEPGERLGDIVVPPGHCALGFRTADHVFVYVEPRAQLLELLGELTRDLLERAGWGSTS
jgi:hypothetical protein